MSDPYGRRPLSPAEFDARCRRLVEMYPTLSETSGRRTFARNERVGGDPKSKHRIGMARDFVDDDLLYAEIGKSCLAIGLWFKIHDAGSGHHIHVQGLPSGDIARWWLEMYG